MLFIQVKYLFDPLISSVLHLPQSFKQLLFLISISNLLSSHGLFSEHPPHVPVFLLLSYSWALWISLGYKNLSSLAPHAHTFICFHQQSQLFKSLSYLYWVFPKKQSFAFCIVWAKIPHVMGFKGQEKRTYLRKTIMHNYCSCS